MSKIKTALVMAAFFFTFLAHTEEPDPKSSEAITIAKHIKAYLSGNEDAASDASVALSEIKDPKFVPHFIVVLKHEDPAVRAMAVRALGRIGDRSAVPALSAALNDKNEGVVMFAADSLGAIGDPIAIDALLNRRRRGGDVFLLKHIVDAVAQIQSKGAENWLASNKIPAGKAGVPHLITALKDESAIVRRYAATALRNIRTEAAEGATALAAAMKDSDADVRRIAFEALHELGGAALPQFSSLLSEKDIALRGQAITGIFKLAVYNDKIDLSPFVPEITRILKDPDENMRAAAATILAASGTKSRPAIPALIESLEDKNPNVARAAASALGGIGIASVQALIEALKNKNVQVRINAAYALGEVGVDVRMVIMMGMFQQSALDPDLADDPITRRGMSALAAIPALTEALKDEDAGVRSMAALSLGRIKTNDGAALLGLNAALNDKDPIVRKAVEQALKKTKAK